MSGEPAREPSLECAPAHAVSLALDHSTSCAVIEDGTVRCWGETFECTRDGSIAERAVPVAVSRLRGVKQLVVKDGSACALVQGGDIACWGRYNLGKTDYDPDKLCEPTVRMHVDRTVELAMNASAYCLRTDDGEVNCVRPTLTPPPIRLHASDGVGLVVDTDLRVLERDGTVLSYNASWGTNRDAFVPIQGLRNVVGMSANINDCVWMRDGTARCDGINGQGQLGAGRRSEFVARPGLPVRLRDIAQVALGHQVGCALRRDRTVWCWGEDPGAAPGLALGLTPQQVASLDDVRAIALGGWHACVLRDDGSVWCWGENLSGELGDGTKTSRAEPRPVRLCK